MKTTKENMELCVGIDLGTTNSVIATINEKLNGEIASKVVNIPRSTDMFNTVNGESKFTTVKLPTLPSYVYYRMEKNYEPLVGDFAKTRYSLQPHLVAKSIKSQMGKPKAEGLSADIPDKTPAQISSRILQHLIREASKIAKHEIKDAVITVPANFDSVMCKATRDAAEMAGIRVKNTDGSERAILLSEPNAVIYDLINQIRNGDLPNSILDLSTKKRVLVFDLGGGTLDITMHEIKRREDDEEVLKVDEIATNRYTLLGGDDFDEEIAKTMYQRYLNKYLKYPEIVKQFKERKSEVMSRLRVYAEILKLDLSEKSEDGGYSSGWDDDDDDLMTVGGNVIDGYAYDDSFTKEEVEEILSVFMGKELKYQDYKRLDTITNTRNIIYPILDVLNKAAKKLGVEDVVVDEVIVNGGMSKFYMVRERLEEFFGFEPIIALDPDQAVARGAAVYHYYLNRHEEMKDDMKMVGEVSTLPIAIEWGNKILNDSLYLGVKNNAVHEIIPTGTELPYTSEIMAGFRIEARQKQISVPIKSRNLDGSYRVIAKGTFSFENYYNDGAYVAFKVHMGIDKVITITAWTSKDREGNEKIEEGVVEIAADNTEKSGLKKKFIAPIGSKLDPKAEINSFLQLCRNYDKCKASQKKSQIAKNISECVTNICGAGNKEDFAEVIMEALERENLEEARMRLFTIARKIGDTWSEAEKRKLARLCMSQIQGALQGIYIGGAKVSTNTQAIYTLSMCGDAEQLNKLSGVHERYKQACLYTHGKTSTGLDWLQEEFEKDAKNNQNNLQFTAYAIGIALRKENKFILSSNEETKIVEKLCKAIKSGKLQSEVLTCCILAIGWICDQRKLQTQMSVDTIHMALETVRDVGYYYAEISKQEKAQGVAEKMINGDLLSDDEEQFLLIKLEQ